MTKLTLGTAAGQVVVQYVSCADCGGTFVAQQGSRIKFCILCGNQRMAEGAAGEASSQGDVLDALKAAGEALALITNNHQIPGAAISEAQLDWARATRRKVEVAIDNFNSTAGPRPIAPQDVRKATIEECAKAVCRHCRDGMKRIINTHQGSFYSFPCEAWQLHELADVAAALAEDAKEKV